MIAQYRFACEKKLISWATFGLLFFLSAFLWAPSRDGLQIVFLFSFFVPVLLLLVLNPSQINEHLNSATVLALTYGAFSVISTCWGDKSFGFFALQWTVLAVWLLGLMVVFSRTGIDIKKYTLSFLIIGCLVIISSILKYYLSDSASLDKRLWGWNVFRNPNEFGAMCGVIALVAVVSAFQSSSTKNIYGLYILGLVGFTGLILSFSRSALLAFFITSLAALFIVRPPLKIWLPPILVILSLALVLIALIGIPSAYLDGRGNAYSYRLIIWTAVIDFSADNIFTGVGMSKNTNIGISGVDIFNHAHNAWLDTYYRTGLIGLLLIFAHLIAVIKVSLFNKEALPLFLWLCFGCLCSIFDGRCFFWEVGAKWFLYWIPAGLIIASARIKSQVAE